jgi:hypothetical protein
MVLNTGNDDKNKQKKNKKMQFCISAFSRSLDLMERISVPC